MNDFEGRLRIMLRERAHDIGSLPEHLVDPTLLPLTRPARHNRRDRYGHRLLIAVAAAVLVVVGLAIGISRSGNDSRPVPDAARTQGPAQSASATSSTTPIQVTACSAPLPSAWRSALETASTFGAVSALPVAVADDGRILVARDFGDRRDVALLPSGGGEPVPLFTVPDPDQNQVQNASLSGDYAVIPVVRMPRGANGVLPTVVSVHLIDLKTRADTLLDSAGTPEDLAGGRTIDGAVLVGGHVYWDVRATYASRTGDVIDYDIATGQRSTLFRGEVSMPVVEARGLSMWATGAVLVPRTVPAPVSAALRSGGRADQLVTDGTSYAWLDDAGRIGWWAPDTSQVRYVSPAAGTGPDANRNPALLVAGPLVYWTGAGSATRNLLDVRTGGVSDVATVLLFAGDGVFAGYAFIGAAKESPTAALRLDTARLPQINC